MPLILQDFITLFLGLIVEAFPFVVLGVVISVGVALIDSQRLISWLTPKNKILSHFVVSILGIFMPVCECGNVPVVRRFMLSGLNVSQAVTFLLAAPIVNPITFLSTWEAFNYDHSIAIIRIVAALFIANLVGLLVSLRKDQNSLLTDKFYTEVCENPHQHAKNKLDRALEIFSTEFITVMRMMVIGAAIAAASQSFIPREVIVGIGSNVVLSVVAMLILAFIISICANVDAFFALSYANTFTAGSILTFLVFGPMIDIKMLTMLRTTFTVRFLILLTTLVAALSICLGLLVNLIG
jgi:uncharacterized membrane protein YraQ (UPF0718 family)